MRRAPRTPARPRPRRAPPFGVDDDDRRTGRRHSPLQRPQLGAFALSAYVTHTLPHLQDLRLLPKLNYTHNFHRTVPNLFFLKKVPNKIHLNRTVSFIDVFLAWSTVCLHPWHLYKQ
jgi:hypothetical protein